MARRQFNPEENRLDYSQMLCPPPGYDLEFAVGMTYSLDMEALLGVPVSLGMFEDYDSSATQNPFFLLEAIRKCSDKLAIFCNADGIKMPQNIRPVYALLENSIFPVSLERNANFHPKLWVIKYHSETEAAVIKVIVLSRNLTFDRSMDIAVEVTGAIGQSILVQHRMLLGMWSHPVLRKRSWMRNISGSARAMTRPLKNGQWIATIGDGSCVRFAAELSRMRRCPITVAREVQTGESVPIVHEMVVANPHSWLDIIRMMVYY